MLPQISLYNWNYWKRKKTPKNSKSYIRSNKQKTYLGSSCIRVLTIHIGFIKELNDKKLEEKTKQKKQKQIENVITEQI